jgi:hypothetical protein
MTETFLPKNRSACRRVRWLGAFMKLELPRYYEAMRVSHRFIGRLFALSVTLKMIPIEISGRIGNNQ